MLRFIFPLAFLVVPLLAGETRVWSNPEGTKRFTAEFVSRSGELITLSREDGKTLTFPVLKLHPEDRAWVDLEHPAPATAGKMPVSGESTVFDTLQFGDSREQVSEKLKASKFVESTVGSTFLGRTGLNGVFRTRHAIGGLPCFLYFDWNDGGKMCEVTLQTDPKPPEEYLGVLKPCWQELIALISTIHGKPTINGGLPDPAELEDGRMLASHTWPLDHGGTVMLGTAQIGEGYQVAVRFTQAPPAEFLSP